MRIDRDRFLVLATALTACHRASAAAPVASAAVAIPPAVAPAPDASRPPPQTEAAVTSTDFCGEIVRQNEAILTHPTGECPGYEKDVDAVRAQAAAARSQPFFRDCHHGHGTWAVLLVSAEVHNAGAEPGGCGWGATYRLVFQPTERTSLRDSAQSEPIPFGADQELETRIVWETGFDYDGDGRDELVLAEDESQSRSRKVHVFRAAGTTVSPYPVGWPADGVADVDGDGRPDLLFGGYFHTITTQTYVTFETYGVPLLLHSLPDGRFSMSDDIARRWAISSCPSPTPAGMSCLQSLSCMRLWGRSPKAMQAWEATATACRDANAELLPGVPPAAETFAKAPLPFRPLNESPPRPLPPTVPLVKAATEGAP